MRVRARASTGARAYVHAIALGCLGMRVLCVHARARAMSVPSVRVVISLEMYGFWTGKLGSIFERSLTIRFY